MRFAMRRRKDSRSHAALAIDQGFSTKQVTTMVVALALTVVLSPVGVRAAQNLAGVVVTDPGGANKAKVDATGNLQVGGTVNVGNTPNVNVGNFPATTSASQSGSWTVGLNGGTNVGIDPSSNTVKVDSTTPVGVTSADDPGRSAYQTLLSFSIPDGSTLSGTQFTVPTGKRLVIRFVSIKAVLPGGQQPFSMEVITTVNGAFGAHVFPTVLVASGGSDQYEGAQDTLLYADPGTELAVLGDRNATTSSALMTFTISGYFIDCTVEPCN